MPFEPLQTDEKLESAAPRERDTDTVMLIGCSGFILAALLAYGLALWPFFVFREIHQLRNLALAAGVGLAQTLAFGAYVSRKYGLASACGYIGGSLTTAVFLFLRMTSEFAARQNPQDMEMPDYPSSWVYIVPTIWVIASFVVVGISLRRSEIDISGNPDPGP